MYPPNYSHARFEHFWQFNLAIQSQFLIKTYFGNRSASFQIGHTHHAPRMKLNRKLLIVLLFASLLPVAYFRIVEWTEGQFDSIYALFESILFNGLVSVVVTLTIAWLILNILFWLNKKVPWNDNVLKRLIVEVLTTFPVALVMGYVFGNIVFYINIYNEQPYDDFILSFLAISTIMTFVLVAISDWFYFFERWKESLVQNQAALTNNALLQKENIKAQYEVLKNQVNPHFLFNSLNVLSSLVYSSPQKAERFIDEFSSLYRYILDQHDEDLVELSEELSIAKSYAYLQSIRFENGVVCKFNIASEEASDYKLFPLAMQTLLENALKHNTASKESPLNIDVSVNNGMLIITNNLQPRVSPVDSTGIGLENIKRKYRYYDLVPKFERTKTHFICHLPLIHNNQVKEVYNIDTIHNEH